MNYSKIYDCVNQTSAHLNLFLLLSRPSEFLPKRLYFPWTKNVTSSLIWFDWVDSSNNLLNF